MKNWRQFSIYTAFMLLLLLLTGCGAEKNTFMAPTESVNNQSQDASDNPKPPVVEKDFSTISQESVKTESQIQAEKLAEQAKESFFNEKGIRRLDKAIALADQAINFDTNCHQAYNIKGIALAFRGDLTGALQNIDHAIKLKPDFAYAHFNRGLSLAFHNKLAEALPSYEEAARLDPVDPWIFFGIASIHSQQQRPQLAIDNLRKAIELDPAAKGVAVGEKDKDFKNIRHLPEFQALIR